VLSMDETLRHWEPAARTYLDQLGSMVAAQLVRRHGSGVGSVDNRPVGGLGDCQFAAVRTLMEERLAEPVSLAERASVAGLSVSQFSRQFKARTASHRTGSCWAYASTRRAGCCAPTPRPSPRSPSGAASHTRNI
jgi:AraC family transcriptional regulator